MSAADGDDPTELFVISYDGRPVGMIQRYLIAGYQRIYSGELTSPDPSDQGPEYVYLLRRASS